MRRFMLAAVAAASLCTSASAAGEPKTLEEVFAPLSEGLCVTIDAVRAIGATVQLTPEQFQFVRGFWMGIPPGNPRLAARRQGVPREGFERRCCLRPF